MRKNTKLVPFSFMKTVNSSNKKWLVHITQKPEFKARPPLLSTSHCEGLIIISPKVFNYFK